jgi:tRNA A-37 threonylcarbamoyl transferase component Bud32
MSTQASAPIMPSSRAFGGLRNSSLVEHGTILGSYRVMQPLGEGAMGVVYLAEHVKLGRRVALKMLRSELADNSGLVARFFGEAKTVNRIAHENIVEITDFCEDGNGHAYYIMELLRGQTLGEVLAEEIALLPRRVVGIAVQICSAMSAVHDAGVVHRDLKPENVFLLERGGRPDFVKILDFGVAKLADAEAMGVRQTAAGTMVGTPQYMSPEQAVGREVDHRTDIYALGVILYELLTGQCPFKAATIGEVIVKHMSFAPRPPSSLMQPPHLIPAAVEAVVMRCLEKQPAARYQTMREVESALRQAANEAGFPIATVGVTAGVMAMLPVGERRRLATRARMGAALAAVVIGSAVAGWLALGGGDDGASAAKGRGPSPVVAAGTARPSDPVAPAASLARAKSAEAGVPALGSAVLAPGGASAAPATATGAATATATGAATATATEGTMATMTAVAAGAETEAATGPGKRGKRGKDTGGKDRPAHGADAAEAEPKSEDRSGTLDPFSVARDPPRAGLDNRPRAGSEKAR